MTGFRRAQRWMRIRLTPGGFPAARKGTFPPFRGLLPLVLLLAIWQFLQEGQSPYFPRPSLWFAAVEKLWRAGSLLPGFEATLESFSLALLLAVVVGSVVGIIVGRSRFLDRALGPLLEYCRVMPPAAILPLFIIFAGYTGTMKISVTVFGASWPILLQVRGAARAMSPALMDSARSMHLRRIATLRKIIIPAITPSLLVGTRIAAPIVLVLVLLVEIVTHIDGLGALIARSQESFLSAQVYGLVAITGCLGLIVNIAVSSLESHFLRYRPGSVSRRPRRPDRVHVK